MIYSSAKFSVCGKYRYALWRIWDDDLPRLGFCMLNPSTADETLNDPTITRCIARAKSMGFGGIIVMNAFAYRSTDPKELYNVEDPVGPQNDHYIRWGSLFCAAVVCGWGEHGKLYSRQYEVFHMITDSSRALVLKFNKDGTPAHPLYIGYKVKPFDIETGKCYDISIGGKEG